MIAAFLGTMAFDLLSAWKFSQFGYHLTLRHLNYFLVFGALIVYLLKTRKFLTFFSTGDWIFFALFLSCYHELLSILSYPLDPLRSDMLESIRQAGERFTDGFFMYAPSTGSVGQMPYLPLSVISYLPSTLLEVDGRWMTIVFRVLSGFVLYRYGSSRARALYHWIWIHPYVNFRHDLYIEPFLFLLVWMSVAQSSWSRVIALSLAQLTLHWAWVIFPFVWLRSRGKEFVLNAVSGVVIVGSGLAYFLFKEGPLFTNAIFMHSTWMNEGHSRGELALGFGALINRLGLQSGMIYVQLTALFTFGLLALKNWRQDSERYMMPAFIVFVACLGFLENYFWIPVLALGALAPLPKNRTDF